MVEVESWQDGWCDPIYESLGLNGSVFLTKIFSLVHSFLNTVTYYIFFTAHSLRSFEAQSSQRKIFLFLFAEKGEKE